MSVVASKNPYDLLGNDVDSEGEIKPAAPKEVVRQKPTTKKKDTVPEVPPPSNDRGGYRGRGRGRNYGGNEAAFRDRDAGRESNRAKDTDAQGISRGGGRGRPRQGGRRDFDRHSGTGIVDTEKKVAQGWGSNKGEDEWTDERVGEQMAQAEADATAAPSWDDPNAPPAEAPDVAAEDEPAAPAEPQEKVKTYDDYLAEKAAQKLALGNLPEARQPNEGTRVDKKWESATPLQRKDEELFSPTYEKNKRFKERKEKQTLEIDQRFQDFRDRGGRERGGRGGRGEGRGRGGGRGERRGGDRGGRNGPRNQPVDIADPSAFPSLGA